MGFVKEAYFRENYYYNGKFLDSEIYSLLEKDFLGK
jgi:ribosomal-protein-alanine N-acetyltransferase